MSKFFENEFNNWNESQRIKKINIYKVSCNNIPKKKFTLKARLFFPL